MRPDGKPAVGSLEEVIGGPGRRRLPLLLRRSWFNLNQAFRRRIAHTGLTPDQFTALRTVLEGPRRGLTQRELAMEMSSDANTVASLVERMERAGLLRREVDRRDRRAYRLRLERSGKQKYEEVRQIALELQATVLAVVPEASRVEFLEHLERVANACRAAARR